MQKQETIAEHLQVTANKRLLKTEEERQAKEKGLEFSVAEGLSVLWLPVIHALEMLLYLELAGDFSMVSYLLVLKIWGPAVFMFCMGYGMTGKYGPKRMISMGIQFLIIQALLLFTKDSVFDFIGACMGKNPWNYVISDVFCNDIYYFVGLFCILFGLLRKLGLNLRTMFLIGVGMLIINEFLRITPPVDDVPWVYFLGNFISIVDRSSFPLMAWFLIPLAGMAAGEFSAGMSYEKYSAFVTRWIFPGIFLILVSWCAAPLSGTGFLENLRMYFSDYDSTVTIICFLLGTTLISMSVLHLIMKHVRPGRITAFFLKMSGVIMPFYIMQWLLVSYCLYPLWLTGCIGEGSVSAFAGLVIGLVIMLADVLFSFRYGLRFMRFVYKITDYRKWFRRKQNSVADD